MITCVIMINIKIIFFIYLTSLGVKLMVPYDKWKDQTLFLSQISQKALQKTVFPLGDLHKDVVKKIATSIGLEKIAKKKEVSFKSTCMLY